MKRLYGEHGRRRIFKEGRLQDLPSEVRQLWHSRNDDLPELPSVGVQEQYMGDGWEDAERAQIAQIVLDVMTDGLRKREFLILVLRFFHDMTLDEVAAAIGVTSQRVRQIEAKALRKLKHPSRSDRLRALMPWFGWAEISNPPVDVYGTPFYFKPEKKTPTKQAEQQAKRANGGYEQWWLDLMEKEAKSAT